MDCLGPAALYNVLSAQALVGGTTQQPNKSSNHFDRVWGELIWISTTKIYKNVRFEKFRLCGYVLPSLCQQLNLYTLTLAVLDLISRVSMRLE